MTRLRTILLASAVLAGGAWLLTETLAGAAETAPAEAPRAAVGVCDVGLILKDMRIAGGLAGKITKRAGEVEAKLRDGMGKIREAEQAMQTMPEGSDDYEREYGKIEQMHVDLRAWQDTQERAMDRSIYVETRQFYKRIVAAAEVVAKQRGMDVVFYEHSVIPWSRKAGRLVNLRNQIEGRRAIYVAKHADITAEVRNRIIAAATATGP